HAGSLRLLRRALEGAAESHDCFRNIALGHIAVAEACVVQPAVIVKERLASNICHRFVVRGFIQPVRIDALRQLEPKKEAPIRQAPSSEASTTLVERGNHCVALPSIDVAYAIHVRIEL